MNNASQSHLGEMSSFDISNEKKLCSLCGLCMVKEWSAKKVIQGCVFTVGWLGKHESNVFGRERSQDNSDEMLFGISKKRFVTRIKNPPSNIQFTGIITSIAKKAFETGKTIRESALESGVLPEKEVNRILDKMIKR